MMTASGPVNLVDTKQYTSVNNRIYLAKGLLKNNLHDYASSGSAW
jgi:hypothetical protein